MNNKNKERFSTRIIASEFSRKDSHGAISMPIYRSAAFEFETSEEIANAFQSKIAAHTYSRISNPTVENLEEKIKQASNAQSVMVVSSGMAAISNTFLTLASAGSNIVASPHIFGNTFSLFQFTLASFGVEVRFVNTDNLQEVESNIDENTCAFFCELITNPHMEIADLTQISKICQRKSVPVIVDTTIVPWCGFSAKDFGVDIEIVSTTKYISGGATSLGGAIVDYGTFDWKKNKRLKDVTPAKGLSAFMFKLKRETARNIGACMDPDSASLQSLGMETLQLRFEKMSQSAYNLAEFLSGQYKIASVNYPALKSSAYYDIYKKMFVSLPGAMLTFSLKTKEECFKLMDNLRIIRRATNLFDNKTLIIHPESTIYGTFNDELKKIMGIDERLLRLSVGLEDTEDLKTDILQALDNSK
ncbi:MAG: aminotransferase class I/II-fold pyridoxal phosphate-dependent enzyme [Dysgonomonas sp.]